MGQLHRRTLPHWFMPGAAHFVTYRLAGTLPRAVIEELKVKKDQLLKQKPKEGVADHRRHVHKVLFAQYEKYLDNVSDIDWLRDPRIASVLRQNLYHHDGSKYHLHAYCIMPNHVHVVVTPSPEFVAKVAEQAEVGETPDKG